MHRETERVGRSGREWRGGESERKTRGREKGGGVNAEDKGSENKNERVTGGAELNEKK